MLLCVTTTTNEQLKIELLSQWKLEAESRNICPFLYPSVEENFWPKNPITQTRDCTLHNHKKTPICLAMSGRMVDVEIVDGRNPHPSWPPTFSESQSGHFGFAQINIPPHEFMTEVT